ncbi:4Fe-4S single cluster domain-containing protein [Polyangium jinanense]|uniref:Radical SAM protein n=1 Tax=Polyangium jinanense TaxID=2829994 RepID=A0A9X3WVR6_9BACT|nr:4Fe-4S single cluster domain-containing protein [Polyangium jinanense]MDC3953857.1 radical SAM protein [Polyangium jinanense]MDC3979022.1 radical SAM protein [Polyangium jinanense]
MTDLLLNLADAVAPSRANGPGARAVLWAQGCSLQCRGCHNPQTWGPAPRRICTVHAAASWVRSFRGLRGVTLSGGEPFEQALGFATLCRALRAEGADIVAFSGFTREEIEGDVRPHARALLAEVDLLIDGRYEAELAARLPLRGSSNQRLHFLTNRIRPDEIEGLPAVEWIGKGERARVTGFVLRALGPRTAEGRA